MTEALILPERRGNTVSWAWSRFADVIPVGQLVGVAAYLVATGTVLAALLGHLNVEPTPLVPLVLFLAVLAVLLVGGGLLILMPQRSTQLLPAALLLSPLIWTAMIFTWNDHGWIIKPIALVYVGALAAAFYSREFLIVIVALCLGAGTIYVVHFSDIKEFPSFVAGRLIGLMAATVVFVIGVYLMRKRVTQVQDALRARSIIDGLTGLPNRRHVNTMAAGLLAAARRQEREVYALQLDIDRLSEINSEAGVEIGDEVLAHVAEIVRNALRPEDLLIRVGGDELLAAGVVRSQFEAMRIAERLRLSVRRAVLPVPVTCSIGVSAARPPSNGIDPAEWLWNLAAIADESLAAAKASGRDHITSARQSGDVLGDALELVTERSTIVSDAAEPVPVTEMEWSSPVRIARATGTVGLAAAVVGLVSIALPDFDNALVRSSSAGAVILATSFIGFVLLSTVLVIRPLWGNELLPALVFAADVIWASSALAGAQADGYINASAGLIMCGYAAWVFPRWLFVAQLVITFPLTFVVVITGVQVLIPDPTSDVLIALGLTVLLAGALVVAAIGLYLLRLHGERLIAQSAASATIDPITGLANRRLLAERAPALVAGAARQNVAVSVILVDIVDFWQVNERQGVPGGDRVLASVAKALYRASRTEDTLLRLDGDNFLIICVGDPEDARRVADRTAAVMSGVSAMGAPLASRIAMASAWPASRVEALPWLLQLITQVSDDMRSPQPA